MKYTIALFLLVFSVASYASGDVLDDEKCIRIYVSTSNAGGKLSANKTSQFLSAIGCEYYSSSEGGGFGAELIVIVLENSTNEFIVAYDKLNPSLQSVIFEAIKSPIHDGFDLQNIYNNILAVNTSSQTKEQLLAAIKQAAKEQNTEIK